MELSWKAPVVERLHIVAASSALRATRTGAAAFAVCMDTPLTVFPITTLVLAATPITDVAITDVGIHGAGVIGATDTPGRGEGTAE